jgi:uncharacterized membrane protein
VFAIILTIMMLEMKAPHAVDLVASKPLLPHFLSYVLRFVLRGNLLEQSPSHVSGYGTRQRRDPWANLHLLFWLSLFPFTTDWMGENDLAVTPIAVYGLVLLMAAIAYYVLQRAIIAKQGRDSILALAIGKDWKGKLSPVLYFIAIPIAFVKPWLSCVLYAAAAIIWLIPERRIEHALAKSERATG